MVELAVATSTPVLSWVEALEHDPRLVSTAVAVLAEQSKKGGRG